ncbi:MAG: GNAT family protein [Bacteroidota bacterium]
MTFDTTKELTLENDRARLTPLTIEHKELLLPFAIHEPELWTYSLISAADEAKMDHYLRIAMQKKEEGDSYPFLVWDKKFEAVAGTTRFYDIQRHHNTLQLGYTWYGSKFQGTGLNKNCKYLLLKYAFETLEVERVEFRADANNQRSIAAMKSIGCIEEGILRNHCQGSDGRRDSIILSIIASEWPEVQKRLEDRIA